jgi:hypothetical protein
MAETVGGGPSKFATFFGTRVAFTEDEKDVGKIAQGLNALGNALLAPTRHLMKGRTATCVTTGDRTSELGQRIIFGHVRGGPSKEKVSKGQAALTAIGNVGLGVLALVGTPLGALVKGLAMISPDLRRKCNEAANFLVENEEDETHIREKAADTILLVRKGMKKKDMQQVVPFLHNVWSQKNLGNLVKELCRGGLMAAEEYEFLQQCLVDLEDTKLPKTALLPSDRNYQKVGIQEEIQMVEAKLDKIAPARPRLQQPRPEREGPPRMAEPALEPGVKQLARWDDLRTTLNAAVKTGQTGWLIAVLNNLSTGDLRQALELYEREYGNETMVSKEGWRIYNKRADKEHIES